ncbi:MAG: phage holin family protein [Bacteroidales bacterium]|nr:phage holin family protein [Bacteroidales bacterium]
MSEILISAAPLVKIAVFVMLLVLLAMIIDLGAGLYKAKQRGELRTSEALRRTLSKFISYEGGIAIAIMVDILISFARFYELIGIKLLVAVPVVTILVGIFLLIVEFMSVREKADRKTKKQQDLVIEMLGKVLTKEEVTQIIKTITEKQAALDTDE